MALYYVIITGVPIPLFLQPDLTSLSNKPEFLDLFWMNVVSTIHAHAGLPTTTPPPPHRAGGKLRETLATVSLPCFRSALSL